MPININAIQVCKLKDICAIIYDCCTGIKRLKNTMFYHFVLYGSNGPGWILYKKCNFFQLPSLNTQIKKQARSKVKTCSGLFCL